MNRLLTVLIGARVVTHLRKGHVADLSLLYVIHVVSVLGHPKDAISNVDRVANNYRAVDENGLAINPNDRYANDRVRLRHNVTDTIVLHSCELNVITIVVNRNLTLASVNTRVYVHHVLTLSYPTYVSVQLGDFRLECVSNVIITGTVDGTDSYLTSDISSTDYGHQTTQSKRTANIRPHVSNDCEVGHSVLIRFCHRHDVTVHVNQNSGARVTINRVLLYCLNNVRVTSRVGLLVRAEHCYVAMITLYLGTQDHNTYQDFLSYYVRVSSNDYITFSDATTNCVNGLLTSVIRALNDREGH